MVAVSRPIKLRRATVRMLKGETPRGFVHRSCASFALVVAGYAVNSGDWAAMREELPLSDGLRDQRQGGARDLSLLSVDERPSREQSCKRAPRVNGSLRSGRGRARGLACPRSGSKLAPPPSTCSRWPRQSALRPHRRRARARSARAKKLLAALAARRWCRCGSAPRLALAAWRVVC